MEDLVVVIPARMASTRYPGKPLVDLAGKPMIQWVYEACQQLTGVNRIVIAAPDEEILEAAHRFGAEAIKTRLDHPSGTDRLAEVALSLPAAAYLNVQGDEPLIEAENLERCAGLMKLPEVEMASLYVDATESEVDNPACVKVVTDKDGWALYFSRNPIPYPRTAPSQPYKKHLGIYAYRGETLQRFTKWPVSYLEGTEGLEQLRFLENGVRIRMAKGLPGETAVDTPEQADEVRAVLSKRLERATS